MLNSANISGREKNKREKYFVKVETFYFDILTSMLRLMYEHLILIRE